MTAVAEQQHVARKGSLLANSAILSTTTLAVSAANYLLNLVLARLLDPVEFGDVSLVVNIVIAGSLVAATLQMIASKTVASAPGRRDAVARVLLRAALVLGGVTFAGLGGGAWALADWLKASTPWLFVILAVGLPVFFVQAVHRGVLQGELRFPRLALSYGVEALVRVALTIVLVALGLGVVGAAIGIAVSFVASGLVAWVRPAGPMAAGATRLADVGLHTAALGATALLVGQTIVNTADLVVSKATFTPAVAGVYAAAALVGRALFFLTSSVVSSVFPVVARADSTPQERRKAVNTAIGLVAAIGVAGTVGIGLTGNLVVSAAFGAKYAGAERLLVPYALATSLFAVANLLAAVGVAQHRVAGALAFVGCALVEIVVLAVWGTTPEALAWLQVLVMGVAVVAVAIAQKFVRHNR